MFCYKINIATNIYCRIELPLCIVSAVRMAYPKKSSESYNTDAYNKRPRSEVVVKKNYIGPQIVLKKRAERSLLPCPSLQPSLPSHVPPPPPPHALHFLNLLPAHLRVPSPPSQRLRYRRCPSHAPKKLRRRQLIPKKQRRHHLVPKKTMSPSPSPRSKKN